MNDLGNSDPDFSDLSDKGQASVSGYKNNASSIRGDYDPSKLSQAENLSRGNGANNLQEAENSTNPESTWDDNTKGGSHASQNKAAAAKTFGGKAKNLLGKLKGKGAAGAIFGSLGLAGIIVGAIGSLLVSLSPVHLAQNFTQKFDFPGISSRARMPKVFRTSNNVNGHRTTTGIIDKKFNKMNQKMVDRMAKQGIEVQVGSKLDNGSFEVTGIKDISSGTDISSKEFNSFRAGNPDFNSRFQTGVGTKFLVAKDKVSQGWRNAFSVKETGIQDASKGNPELSQEDLSEVINEKSNNIKSKKAEITKNEVAEDVDKDGNRKDTGESSAGNTEDDYNKTFKEVQDAAEEANPTAATKAARAIGALGVIQDICGYAQTANTISKAGKILRAVQLAGYAMTFMQVANKIMAGDAGAQEVAKVGTILTSEFIYQKGTKTVKSSAMDSPGMKYAFTGKYGGSSDATMDYSIGDNTGNIIGQGALSGIVDWVKKFGDGTCGLMNSGAGTLVSLGITVIPVGGWISKTLSAGASSAIALAKGAIVASVKNMSWTTKLSVASSGISSLASVFAPQIAQLITGKIVGDFTNGIDAGEAISSGFLVSSSLSGLHRGNLALTDPQKKAYYNLQQEQIAEAAEIDRQNRSPFDPTSTNTFIGSIISKSIPYTASFLAPTKALSSIGSIASSSFRSLLPSAAAEDNQAFEEFTSSCKDPAIQQLGASADPYCNPIMGIPVEYLDDSVPDIMDYLANENQLTEDGRPKANLKKFQDLCVDNSSSNIYGVAENSSSDWKSFLGINNNLDGWKKCTAVDEGNGWTVKDKSYYAMYFQDISLSEGLQTWGEDTTEGSDSDDKSGLLLAAGDGKEMIEQYMKNIVNSSEKRGEIQAKTNYDFNSNMEECYALSMYYAWKISGGKATNPMQHGAEFARNISKQDGWKMTTKPVSGAIFSVPGGVGGSPAGTVGHTGIILEVKSDGSYIILDNNWKTHDIYHEAIPGGGGIGLRSLPPGSVTSDWDLVIYTGGS